MIAGEAQLVTDPATVAEIAALWADGGWPAQPDDSGHRHHRAVQRPDARAAAMARLPGHATHGDRRRDRRRHAGSTRWRF